MILNEIIRTLSKIILELEATKMKPTVFCKFSRELSNICLVDFASMEHSNFVSGVLGYVCISVRCLLPDDKSRPLAIVLFSLPVMTA